MNPHIINAPYAIRREYDLTLREAHNIPERNVSLVELFNVNQNHALQNNNEVYGLQTPPQEPRLRNDPRLLNAPLNVARQDRHLARYDNMYFYSPQQPDAINHNNNIPHHNHEPIRLIQDNEPSTRENSIIED